MKAAITLVFVLLSFLYPLKAEKRTTTPTIQRFGESEMQTIKTQVRFTTMLILPAGEEISEVICGDKEFWVIEGKGSRVYVKPSKEGAATNIIVTTKSDATYSYFLREVSKAGGTSKEKPDISVMLDVEEFSKLKRDKENLIALLADAEKKASNPVAMPGEDPSSKKAESGDSSDDSSTGLAVPATPVPLPKKSGTPLRPDVKTDSVKLASVTTATPNTSEAALISSSASTTVTPAKPEAEAVSDPIRVFVVERQGFLRRAGRSLWGAIRKMNQVLRIY